MCGSCQGFRKPLRRQKSDQVDPVPCVLQLLRVDVSILDMESTRLDSALKVCFSPASTAHLLVTTTANKILWVSAKSGRLLREVSP